MDSRELRTGLGHFATGVAVVTCEDASRAREAVVPGDGRAASGLGRDEIGRRSYGVTVNSFVSVSLDPAMISVSLHRSARGATLLGRRPYTVNVLARDQHALAMAFAGRPQSAVDLPWTSGPHGPRLEGCLAYLSCRPWRSHDAGDHTIFLGEVLEIDYRTDDPLIFYRGSFAQPGQLASADAAN